MQSIQTQIKQLSAELAELRAEAGLTSVPAVTIRSEPVEDIAREWAGRAEMLLVTRIVDSAIASALEPGGVAAPSD